MKRGAILLALAILLAIPFTSATIVLEGPQKTHFNLGDDIPLTGYIQQDEPVTGYLELSADCGEKSIPLEMVPVTLTAGQQMLFPSDIHVPKLSATMAMEGTCNIKADLTVGNVVIDWSESNSFQVTKDLEGNFAIAEPRVQVGNDVDLSGTVSKLDGTKISGSAEVYFKKNDTRYLVNVLNFQDGILSYTHKTSAIPEGRYFIDLLVRDTFGNEKLFVDAASFVLIRQLYLTAKIDKDKYLPGETVTISGEAKTVLQDPVASASVLVTIDSKSYKSKMTEGKFEGAFQLPSNIKSGMHEIKATVQDDAGNVGLAKLRLDVTPIPSNVNVRLNKQEFLPGDLLEVTGSLYDQASDLMDGTLQLDIMDQNGNTVVSKEIPSSEKQVFSFPDFAKPGEWTVRVTKDDLQSEEKIQVQEHNDLGLVLEDTLLKIKNLGNVKFSDNIQIEATGPEGTFTVEKKASLDENETAVIDLSSQLPTGLYAINVKASDKELQFPEVNVLNGKSWHSFNIAYLALVMVCVGLLSYAAYSKVTPPKAKSQKKSFRVQDVEPKGESRKRFSIYNIGKDKEGEMAEFKARILRDMKRTEEQNARRQQSRTYSAPQKTEEKPTNEGGGFFSMFD